MFPQKQKTTNNAQKPAKHHIYQRILWGMLLVFLILCSVTYLSKKTVQLSYSAQETCTRQILFLPDAYKSPDSGEGFAVRHADLFKVSNTTLFSFKTCFRPIKSLQPGSSELSITPNGGLLASKTFEINVPAAPKASAQLLSGPVSTIRPLKIKLSNTDGLNDYLIHADQKISKCAKIDSAISCDMKSLSLMQDKDYPIKITRSFNGGKPEVVVTKTVHTLQATNIIQAAIVDKQVIYDSPTSFTFKFDRPIEDQKVSLTKVDDKTSVAITTETTGETLKISSTKPLDRESSFELRLDDVIAVDGSTLGQPYIANFRTSGGPTVSGVNVGSYGLQLAQTITISLDQPVSGSVANLVSVSGVVASVTASKQQITVSYRGAMPCSDINISIKAGLKSIYGTVQNRPWSFKTRTVCHTTATIGRSKQGRAITANIFGSGPKTILFIGNIHGNEVSAKRLMDAWSNELEVNYGNIPSGTKLIVIPTLNPDGLAANRRTNASNVDLNRNFPTADWQTDTVTVSNKPFPGGGGTSPLSEPEARAIADYTSILRPRLVMSFHSTAGYVIANQVGDSMSLANLYAKLSGYRNVTGTSGAFSYTITGSYDDWVAEKLGIPAVLIELSSSSDAQFSRNKSALWAMVRS